MQKLYTLFVLLCLVVSSQAQTFYEVNYTDNDGEEFLGLMIYYDDENCKMRLISSTSMEEGLVFESQYVNMVEDKEDEEDVGMMAYYPLEKKFPIFVWFWQEDDANDISEKPYVTYNIKKIKQYTETEYFREISLGDMSEDYISQFYGENEPEYRMLLNGINLVKLQGDAHRDIDVTVDDPVFTSAGTSNQIEGVSEGENVAPGEGGNTLDMDDSSKESVLHLIVVANTTVSDIGTACEKDMINLSSEFGGIARVLGMKYDLKTIKGQSYSKENLAQLIRNFNPNQNDVVIFVYTGHGFRFDDQQDYYPNMDLSPTSYDDPVKNYIALSDIYKELVT